MTIFVRSRKWYILAAGHNVRAQISCLFAKKSQGSHHVAFNFREFFRVNEAGNFIHEKDVKAFLNLISKEDKDSCYPFANEEYRNIFRHTLWMLPGVKEARVMSALLQSHPVFQHFKVVNVTGNGNEDEESKDALEAVKEAIGTDPDATRTITLSCGRLTTGVSVKAWTGVFMLSGSYNTAASSYMQTIFRVQTPATINGRVKEQCYVFDFAPDRMLKVIAETAKISSKAGKTSGNDRKIMGEFLNFCPIISIEGSKMEQFDVPKMLEQLKRVYVERVVRNGFEDKSLYNDELMKLNDLELQEFDDLKKIIGQTKAMPKTNQVDINNQGLTDEQYEELEELEKKSKKRGKDKQPLTEEEKQRLEELKKKKNNREAAISILRGISIRMPLLIYGAELNDENQEITIDNFASLIDHQSWEEFMPKGVTKQKFNSIKKYYDPEIFCAAGKRIRAIARAADKLSVEERIERITDIFSTFRNPDKETVLTPWRVVNMHLGDCLGGYNFFEKNYETTLSEPRFIDHGEVTANVFAPDSRILEINSKSGLYPLYMAYSIYRARIKNSLFSVSSIEDEQRIWDKVVAENIFVICKTPMAKSITKRTLIGFRKAKVNTRYFEDLINQIKNKPEHFIKQVDKFITERTGIKNMKINAIVGNPPYQVSQASDINANNRAMAGAIYPLFVDAAAKLNPNFVSMITPSRWMTKNGRGVSNEWVDKMLNGNHFISIFDFTSASDCFNNVEIKGGVNYFLYSPNYSGPCTFVSVKSQERMASTNFLNDSNVGFIIRDAVAQKIISKVQDQSTESFMSLVGPNTLFCDCAKGILNTNWDKYSINPSPDHTIKYYLNKKAVSCGFAWIKPSDMIKSYEVVPLHKVYIPEAAGTGNDNQILGTPFYGEPGSICSQTYICIGYKPDKQLSEVECHTVIKYLRTKFLRYLVSIKKNTQHGFAQVYQLVPMQDFTSKSDIDWSKSIPEIDQQLYTKYGFSEEEIAFIEAMIKPM